MIGRRSAAELDETAIEADRHCVASEMKVDSEAESSLEL
jgi:hypothetical protein